MIETALDQFCMHLRKRPALYIEQDYLRLDSGKDHFLGEIIRKYEPTEISSG
jgi:hypothetical protein